jgi:hypothetical protein
MSADSFEYLFEELFESLSINPTMMLMQSKRLTGKGRKEAREPSSKHLPHQWQREGTFRKWGVRLFTSAMKAGADRGSRSDFHRFSPPPIRPRRFTLEIDDG